MLYVREKPGPEQLMLVGRMDYLQRGFIPEFYRNGYLNRQLVLFSLFFQFPASVPVSIQHIGILRVGREIEDFVRVFLQIV